MTTSLQPDLEQLSSTLHSLIAEDTIRIDPAPCYWESGVYSIIDCVFSAQTKYETIVLPMLRERLSARPGMEDHVSLRFSDLMADIDSLESGREPNRWDAYGKAVLNLQVLAGRRKVEVCYDIASFFTAKKLETMTDLQHLGEADLMNLVMGPMQKSIKGIGPALARYLAILFGVESELRPDPTTIRLFRALSDWRPKLSNSDDMAAIKSVIEHVATGVDTTPARLENALMRHASQM